MNIYKLSDLKKSCGGKADGLHELFCLGIDIPDGFVLYKSNEIKKDDIEVLKSELSNYDRDTLFAVRSSANVEDGNQTSFAGVFQTVLNVKNDISAIMSAINVVNGSMNSEIAKNYNINGNIQMNIVIQKMIHAKISGICFTNAIDTDGESKCLIEYINGLGEKLVSGKTNPNRLIVNYKKGILDSSKCNDEVFINLINKINVAIKHFKYDLDIEWCYDGDKVYLLQARPITKTIFISSEKENNSFGFVASRGYADAETFVVDTSINYEETQRQIDNFEKGKILVTEYTETYFLPAMKKCSGIITNTGSMLCHAAIVSREFGIPCIVGYENATEVFKTGTRVILDANNDRIILNDKEMKSNKDSQIDFGSLDCFDDYYELNIDGFKVFVDDCYDGIYIQKPNDLPQNVYDDIELYIRKKHKKAPKYSKDDGKYLWIMEVERFRKLPFFNHYYDRIKESAKKFDSDELIKIQNELIELVIRLTKHKGSDKIINAFIDESTAAINELLDGIIPFGFPLYYSYIYSKDELSKYKFNFNDLFIRDFKDIKLNNIKKYLKTVEMIKNSSYQKIWDIGGINPDYYEKRDNNIKDTFEINDDNVMNEFYEKYIEYFINYYEGEINK